MKSSELTSTQPGHSLKSKGGSRRTVFESSTSPEEAEKEHFAEQLAEVVNDGARKQSFDGLILVAPPHFAGILEHHLSAEAKKRAKAKSPQRLHHHRRALGVNAWKMRCSHVRVIDNY
jgi:protein required for attachment to host cells